MTSSRADKVLLGLNAQVSRSILDDSLNELERVKWVMKGGRVVKDELGR